MSSTMDFAILSGALQKGHDIPYRAVPNKQATVSPALTLIRT